MFNGSNIQSWHDMVASFNPLMVQWLVFLLAAEFILGVILSFKDNKFSFDEIFNIGKKLVTIAVVWGVGNILDPTVGNAFYGLAVTYLLGGVTNNLNALMSGSVPSGILGQLLFKGKGDGTVVSSSTPVVKPTSTDNAFTIK